MSDKHTQQGGGERPPIALASLAGGAPAEIARDAANQTPGEAASEVPDGDAALIQRRIEELQSEHTALDALIEKLASLQSANEFELRRLKKRKLKVKDSIILLQLHLEPDSRA